MKPAAVLCTRIVPAWLLLGAAGASAQAVALAAAPAVPVRAAPDRFEIAAFDVSGVHALDTRVVEDAVYPFAGPAKTAADVEGARKALEDAYKAHGYESVLVEIPPQPNGSFVAGVVTLRVTRGDGRAAAGDGLKVSRADRGSGTAAGAEGGHCPRPEDRRHPASRGQSLSPTAR